MDPRRIPRPPNDLAARHFPTSTIGWWWGPRSCSTTSAGPANRRSSPTGRHGSAWSSSRNPAASQRGPRGSHSAAVTTVAGTDMRIALVSNTLPPENLEGAQLYVSLLASTLAEEHEVLVL